jgi:biopolymer transport protein ExbB
MGRNAWIVVVMACAAPAEALGSQAGGAALHVQSVWDFVLKGGWMMAPIGACSLVALALLAERLIALRRGTIVPGGLAEQVAQALEKGEEGVDEALRACDERAGPLSRLARLAIARRRDGAEDLERRVLEGAQREIAQMRRGLKALSLVAAVAPLLGLLGTVMGMIRAFQTVAASGEALGRTELLATGIYEALITTAAGLLVAIPTLVFHHVVSTRVERRTADLDAAMQPILDLVRGAPAAAGA